MASINYTQWQSQCGLVGRPTLRRYNPRKQVRDQDPHGEFIREWVPELEALPDDHLDRPEHTPVHVQSECGVRIGETYPRPVVDYDAARKEFDERLAAVRADAADALGRPEIAGRASLSGGRDAAAAIARKHGSDSGGDTAEQSRLDAFGGGAEGAREPTYAPTSSPSVNASKSIPASGFDSGSLALPQCGDCTHAGHPSVHSQSRIIRRVRASSVPISS